ncbi:MAG: 6-phosphofructokinase [Caldilineaceae bacterium]
MAQKNHPIKTIALSTGGGDAPGLNAVIRAAVLAAHKRGWHCLRIRDGYNGLLMADHYNGDGVISLTEKSVRGITHLGGTILGTTNRGQSTAFPNRGRARSDSGIDRTDELIAQVRKQKIDALIAIGGDSSLEIASVLAQKGLRVVGVPQND